MITKRFVGYRCPTNYRSPESIARFIRSTLPVKFELGNDLPGMGVGVNEYDKTVEQPKIVAKIVQNLVRRGFPHDDIVIVSCRGARNSVFSEQDRVGPLELRRFTGEYDAHGNQVLTSGHLTFDMGQLRSVYPNVLHLERPGLLHEGEVRQPGKEQLGRRERELFGSFFEQMTGDPLSEA